MQLEEPLIRGIARRHAPDVHLHDKRGVYPACPRHVGKTGRRATFPGNRISTDNLKSVRLSPWSVDASLPKKGQIDGNETFRSGFRLPFPYQLGGTG